MEADDGKLHIVVFPWLAFGHMLPFLELSKSLARRGHLVSYITTPKNFSRLPKPPQDISHLIHFIPFPLPHVHGLSDDAEATTDVAPHNIHFLNRSIDGLQKPFANFISTASPKPDWIIQDYVQHWIPDAADAAGIRCAFFGPIPAACLTFFGAPEKMGSRKDLKEFTTTPPWVPYPSKVVYRRYEILRIRADFARDAAAAGGDDYVGFVYRMSTAIRRSTVVAVRSCLELEPEWLPLLQEIYGKPVIPVGLLPPFVTERSDNDDANIIEWLNKQGAKTVVYIALGSEVALNNELLHELAHGLELAKIPFLWGLRRPFGVSNDEEILPEGFEERTAGFGKVVVGWVPQLKVFGHEAVGGFLTHCGWSSIIEGIQAGHPMVMLPIFGDQGLNARMLSEKGLGVEVERNEDDGSFTRKEVEKALKLVMVDEEGEGFRKKAAEMKEMFADKERHEKYLDGFVAHLVSNRISSSC